MSDLLAAVLVGHLIGDWVVQTDWQAANKVRPARFETQSADEEYAEAMTMTVRDVGRREPWFPDPYVRAARRLEERRKEFWRSWYANQMHMLGYHSTLMLFLGLLVPSLSIAQVAILVGVSWVTHSFIDRRWPVRWLMQHTGSAPFSQTTFGVVGVDQALHLSILCLLVALLT